jgi:hypothetical protein
MKKKRSRRKNAGLPSRPWWVGSLILFVVILGVYWHEASGDQQVDPALLAGRWQRPDGGYLLELRGIGPEGLVKAAYFNPRPINVSRSEWQRKDGRLELFVELHDVNYPGSTYTLVYQAENDSLYGIYYQAALGQMFEVEFVRVK